MNIGKIQKIDVRKIWMYEDRDFTPWVASNIDHLNQALGLDISVLTTEENVGPYRVDIYGEDLAGNKVIIENQLEKTDHSHLGQLLTYMTNLDAKTIIWISPSPTVEHKKVIEWLNEITPDDISFYLVMVEGIAIEGVDTVAPLFTISEAPSVDSKKLGTAKKEFAGRYQVRRDFWTKLINEMNKSNRLLRNVSPAKDAWIGAALGMTGVGLNLVVSKNYARTEIYINRGSQEENKRVFDLLAQNKEEIEGVLGHTLEWERMDDKVSSRIKDQLDGVSLYNEADWDKMIAFMVNSAAKMHAAFTPQVQRLRSLKYQG